MSLVFLLFLFPLASSLTLSHLTALLPCLTQSNPLVQLEISGPSCLVWSNAKPRLLSMEVKQSCQDQTARSILVRPIVMESCVDIRNAWITASDGKDQVGVEVFVASIRRLEFLTNTHIIHAGEEIVLQIQGFDSYGNVFDTLAGLPFSWFVSDPSVKLQDMGDKAIIQGISVGGSDIRAKLDDLIVDIKIIVVEPVYLVPGDMDCVPCMIIDFQLFFGSHGVSEVTNIMPNPNAQLRDSKTPIKLPTFYNFTSDDSVVINNSGFFMPLSRGVHLVTVYDSRLPFPLIAAQSEVRALSPDRIIVRFHPKNVAVLPTEDLDIWALTPGHYVVTAALYSYNFELYAPNPIEESDLLLVKTESNSYEIIIIEDMIGREFSLNFSWTRVSKEKPNGELCNFEINMSISKRIIIVPVVQLAPQEILLPPAPFPAIFLTASGGSKEYRWNPESGTSNLFDISHLNNFSHDNLVSVADMYNPYNKASSWIQTAPLEINWLVDQNEVALGSCVVLTLLALSRNREFSNVTSINPIFNHEGFSLSFVPLGSSWLVTVCATILGSWPIEAVVTNRVETTLRVFAPLRFEPDSILIASGYSNMVRCIGGPTFTTLYVDSNITLKIVKPIVHVYCNIIEEKDYEICTSENEVNRVCGILHITCVPPLTVSNMSISVGETKTLTLPRVESHVLDGLVSIKWPAITGLELGYTRILLHHRNCSNVPGLFTMLYLTVEFDDFNLINDTFTMVGHEAFASVVPRHSSPLHSSFEQVRITWETDVLNDLKLYSPDGNETLLSGCSIRVAGLPGKYEVRAHIVAVFPRQRNWIKTWNILIVPAIQLDSPTLLILPPKSSFRVMWSYVPYSNISEIEKPYFEILGSSVMDEMIASGYTEDYSWSRISSDGVLTSASADESAVIRMLYYGIVYNINLLVTKPTHFKLLYPEFASETGNIYSNNVKPLFSEICVGKKLTVQALLCDDMNRPFTVQNSVVAKTNIPGVVEINQFNVTAVNTGVVRIGWEADDIVPLYVEMEVIAECRDKSEENFSYFNVTYFTFFLTFATTLSVILLFRPKVSLSPQKNPDGPGAHVKYSQPNNREYQT